MRINVIPVLHTRVLIVSTLITSPVSSNNRIRTGNPVYLPGNNWVEGVDRDLTGARLLLFPSDLPRHRSSINDNYCAQFVTGTLTPVSVTGQNCCVTGNVVTRTPLPVSYHVASHVPFAGGSPQKKGIIPEHQSSIKFVKGVSCVNQLSSVQNVTNVPSVAPNPPVGSRLHNFWERWAALGVNPKVISVLREGYILPFWFRPYLTRKPTVTSCYVDPHRNSYLLEALHQLLDKNAVELVQNPQSLGFYNRLFLVPKPNNRWRPILDLSKLNKFLETQTFKMETPETIRTSLQTGEWVTSIDFKDAYFHFPIISQVHAFSYPRQDLSIQSTTLWPVHGSHGVHSDSQRGQVASHGTGYKDLPVPRRLVGQSQVPPSLSSTDTKPSNTLQGPRMVGKRGKVRTGTQTDFQFRRLPVRLEGRQGQTYPRTLAESAGQDTGDFSLSSVSGPELHAPDQAVDCHGKTGTHGQITYKTHTVAPQEQLENPRDFGEDHSHTQITPPTSEMVAGGGQCYHRPTPAPSSTCTANLYRRIKRRVGHSFKRAYGKGKLVTNYLELKAVLLALREFQALCTNRVVLIATDNTTVVAYINKEGGMKSGPLCALLWRILTWCTRNQVTLKARHIPGRLNVSRQTIQTGPNHSNRMVPQPRGIQGNMQPVAQAPSGSLCHQVQQQASTVSLPSPRCSGLGSGCPQFVLGGTGPLRLPTSSHLGQMVEKLQDYPCNRIILIAPGWPNMPWFWDLVAMSSQIPLCLPNIPNLVSQPFNQVLHRNLPNLNLHAWLLEPQQSRSKVSLRQWQHELRLRKEDRPDLSMRQSGPFLQSGVSVIRWTSGQRL